MPYQCFDSAQRVNRSLRRGFIEKALEEKLPALLKNNCTNFYTQILGFFFFFNDEI